MYFNKYIYNVFLRRKQKNIGQYKLFSFLLLIKYLRPSVLERKGLFWHMIFGGTGCEDYLQEVTCLQFNQAEIM